MVIVLQLIKVRSTYENCYVVMSNILTACPKYKDAIRSLYTSVTRPSKSLTLYY